MSESDEFKGKRLAGCYYLPVNDGYASESDKSRPQTIAVGKTLGEREVIIAQENSLQSEDSGKFLPVKFLKNGNIKNAVDDQAMDGYKEYAKKVSERAIEHMLDGVIVRSPYGKACENCKFKSLCDADEITAREIKSVNSKVILDATNGEGKDERGL